MTISTAQMVHYQLSGYSTFPGWQGDFRFWRCLLRSYSCGSNVTFHLEPFNTFDGDCIALHSFLLCCSPPKLHGYLSYEKQLSFLEIWFVQWQIWYARDSQKMLVCCFKWAMKHPHWSDNACDVTRKCHQDPCVQILVLLCYVRGSKCATCTNFGKYFCVEMWLPQVASSKWKHCRF